MLALSDFLPPSRKTMILCELQRIFGRGQSTPDSGLDCPPPRGGGQSKPESGVDCPRPKILCNSHRIIVFLEGGKKSDSASMAVASRASENRTDFTQPRAISVLAAPPTGRGTWCERPEREVHGISVKSTGFAEILISSGIPLDSAKSTGI